MKTYTHAAQSGVGHLMLTHIKRWVIAYLAELQSLGALLLCL
jgi:hypothetical protein